MSEIVKSIFHVTACEAFETLTFIKDLTLTTVNNVNEYQILI